MKNVLAFALLTLVVWQILIFAPTTTEEPEEAPKGSAIATDETSPQWMKGVNLVESDAGERQWELWAERAHADERAKEWEMRQVKVHFYSEGKHNMTVTGDWGKINVTTKDMQIKGAVKTVTDNGYEFTTPSLRYTSSTHRLESKEEVQMLGPRVNDQRHFQLNGKHLVALVDKGSIDIKEAVQTKMYRKGKPFQVNSSMAKFSTKSRLADFFGDVVIDVETLRVTGPRASFKYKQKSEELDSVKVTGGIRVTDLDKWATSKTVDIEFDSDKFVFKGEPKLVQGGDEMLGQIITFLNGGKRVKVDRARARVDKEEVE